MNRTRSILLGSFAAMTLIAGANAATAAPGTYKLAIGNKAPCDITLAADGTATYANDCAYGGGVARWQAGFNKLDLQKANGETVGLLSAKGDTYVGTRASDGKTLILTH
jgi:hypothetical protein